ncbi:MAG: FHA domain-containing protein [bacterium]
MTDQNRKTLRSFYCRDYLWEIYEQMTTDLGCSMDYLINESMRLYARSRDYVPANDPAPAPGPGDMGGGFGGGYGNQPMQPQQPMAPQLGGGFSPMEHRTFNQIPPINQQQPQRSPTPPQQPMGGVQFGQQPQRQIQQPGPPPPPRPSNQWQQAPPQAPPAQNGGYGQPMFNQPGPAPAPQQPMMGGAAQPPLYLMFNNNRYVIDKDKFVIGRGSQQTDLTIRDGNISRKHCCVIFRNGAYYIKDLDSTNGIEFRGNRIESKKVEEGDTFYLCDYELRFTYRP